jgi:peroxiredoxin
MKSILIISLLLLATSVMLGGIISCSSSTSSASGPHEINNVVPPEIGKPAPNFTVTSLSGKTVNLSDFSGDMVLVDFWSVGCDQCNMERDLFEAVHEEYPDIQIMMVDSKDDIGIVKRFVRSYNFSPSVYMDKEMTAAGAFDVNLIPETFLINKTGIIEYIQDGAFCDQLQLENALKLLQ